MGEAPERTTLVQRPDDVDDLELPTDKPLVWLSQTTLSVDETLETVSRLRQKFPLLVSPPSDASATPPRTGSRRSSRSPRTAT